MLHTKTYQWEYTIVTGREQKKKACQGFLVAPASFPSKKGGRSVGGGGQGLVPKIDPPKTECLPSHPSFLALHIFTSQLCECVCPSPPQCCLAGAQATHTETVRRLSRHKNLQGCSLFPRPSLSTIQINILGVVKKSEKKSGHPPTCV